MKHPKPPFKWRHFEPSLILLGVGWYCRYQLSYRDLEEMTREQGLSVDHVTIYRWVQRYAPEINQRMRPHLKMSGTSHRLDETYVKVGKSCKYLSAISVNRRRRSHDAKHAPAARVQRFVGLRRCKDTSTNGVFRNRIMLSIVIGL